MKKNNALPIFALLIVLSAGGALYWFRVHPPAVEEAPLNKGAALPEPQETPTPRERYPVPAPSLKSVKGALPKLEESDPSIEEALQALIGKPIFQKLFEPTGLIRRLVVSVENAKEPMLPLDLILFHSVTQSLKVTKKDEKLFLDPLNFERYAPYAKLAETTNLKKAADIYFEYYPLFQSAYREVNPQGHFNDRLIEIMDHLISTPLTPDSVELIPLTKSYHFSDPKLESLSITQKALIRMGNSNSEIIKVKLRALRNIIILGQ